MNQDERFLIAIDLDDTILSELFSLSAESVWALRDAQEAGHIVMIATARPWCITEPYYLALGLNSLVSVMNGSYMYHPKDTSAPTFRHDIDAATTRIVLDAMQDNGVEHIFLEANDDLYTADQVYPGHPYWKLLADHSIKHVMDPLPAVACTRIYGKAPNGAAAEAVRERIAAGGNLRVHVGEAPDGTCHIHVWSIKANKWYTVQEAAEYYGIRPENIMTFGDERIDDLMTRHAAHGYVMCNGNREMVEEAIAEGRGVTKHPCADGGVGYEIRRILGI